MVIVCVLIIWLEMFLVDELIGNVDLFFVWWFLCLFIELNKFGMLVVIVIYDIVLLE